jgi:hypothetical protein
LFIRSKARNTKIATFGKSHQILIQGLKLFKIALQDRKEAYLAFMELTQ